MHCALCGRPLLQAAVMIGREGIGPKCAKKAGLTALAKKTGSRVLRIGRRPSAERKRMPETMDLFEDERQVT